MITDAIDQQLKQNDEGDDHGSAGVPALVGQLHGLYGCRPVAEVVVSDRG
ncbi:hypothetical protein [Nonomuraea jabiensis]